MTLATRRHTRAFGIWKQQRTQLAGRRMIRYICSDGGEHGRWQQQQQQQQQRNERARSVLYARARSSVRMNTVGNDKSVLGLGCAVVECCRQW
jgi:hypothetical protein